MRHFFHRCLRFGAFAVAVPAAAAPLFCVSLAMAQAQVADAPASGSGAAGAQTGARPSMYPAAPPPGVPVGGGNNTSSSSTPRSGNQRDSFDLGTRRGGGGTAFGNEGAQGYVESEGTLRLGDGAVPDPYTVRRGDTLWGICDTYFRNPYQWPRIWSFNPQLQNPHWIYPGDLIRMRAAGAAGASALSSPGGASLIDRRRQVAPQTVFLRDAGFIDDDSKDSEDWGEITGAAVDKMFLTDTDAVYLRIGPNHDPHIGQELTVFRPGRSAGDGRLVQIQGSVRIDQFDAKTRVARAQVSETIDVIERGARVGPVGRKFNVVQPTRNDADVVADVIASVYPHNFYGQNQVVFINKGVEVGLRPGNRLFVVRRGDAWRKSLASSVAGNRIALESDSVAAVESIPLPPGDAKLPEEVLGELRVLTVRAHTAACLVTQASREIEQGDDAVARKGY